MMGRTHFAVGMAASLAVSLQVMQPQNVSDCLIALAGGAVGGVLADADTIDNDYNHDALIGQLLGFAVLVMVMAIDYFMKLGVCEYVIHNNTNTSIIAGIAFIILYIIGVASEHRSFTHSLLAMLLFSFCFGLVVQRLGFFVLVGYASHLLLDLLNKKDVPLLYPRKKGICFKVCYANKTANTVFMFAGFITTIGLLGYLLIPYVTK